VTEKGDSPDSAATVGSTPTHERVPTVDAPAPLRVLYVEDDPALRGILTTLLDGRAELTIAAALAGATEALDFCQSNTVDVALLDLALGDNSLTGIELGMAIRRLQPAVGIVMLSQHSVPGYLTRLEEGQRRGWSFIMKRADLHPRYLSDVIQATARGLNVVDPEMVIPDARSGESATAADNIIGQLSARHREVMALAATGLDAPSIASRLDLTASTVRQDLSRAYQVLVPDPPAGADLRTLAVLRYLREVRSFDADHA
jgi:two-component system, NarL family, response regulator DesR